MKNSTLDRDIRSRVDAFVIDLTNLVRITTLQAVHDAFGAQLDLPRIEGVNAPCLSR